MESTTKRIEASSRRAQKLLVLPIGSTTPRCC
jgi:hypothetical protein